MTTPLDLEADVEGEEKSGLMEMDFTADTKVERR
jgi:hypothetical protein